MRDDGRMRGSTKVAIWCTIGWLLSNLFACAQAPRGLDDPDFGQRVAVGSGLQGLGSLLLIAAIIAIVITIYKNIMDKHIENRIIQGHNIEASGSAVVATDYGRVTFGDRKMTEYKNYGQVGAMGDKARSDNNTFGQKVGTQLDLAELATQLAKVRTEMKKQANPDSREHDEAIGSIASAEKAALNGDQSETLKSLKVAGGWALEIAKSVAAGLVQDAIEGKFGS